MGAVEKFARSQELAQHLIDDADRPEHRYLGSELLEYLTSGKLPREALKDYAILRWAFQAHANPAMMLSHAAFLEGEDVEQLRIVAVSHLERFARGAPLHVRWD